MPNQAKDLSYIGLTPSVVHWDLSDEALSRESVERKETKKTSNGAIVAKTGKFTGRSPNDRYIVKDSLTKDLVDWGDINKPMSEENFEKLLNDQKAYINGKELFGRDAFAGADKEYRISIRVVNEKAWSNLFCRHMFLKPSEGESFEIPDVSIIHTPGFTADPKIHGTNSPAFVVLSLSRGLVIIGGTKYAGEMKKSIFSFLNFCYPSQGILPMHCSANVDKNTKDNTALFFGLSGTGKTTLSADPNRSLIGDDEHGWSEKGGIFNFEGGCYAKAIRLRRDKEPEIWDAIREGAILENVVIGEDGVPDYDDGSLTENTRVSYPLDHVANSIKDGIGPHPKNIIFLTCDAFGVIPPVSKLLPEQAMYHFLSGYTAKVAGTERGLGNKPEATFSSCFGAPFLPLHPTHYADMLREKMTKHKVNCWLLNTGWIGGPVGVGDRIKLPWTRAMVTAILDGSLEKEKFNKESIFGLHIPQKTMGVPDKVLNPASLWEDQKAYDQSAENLARLFIENFKQYMPKAESISQAGPSMTY